MSSNKISQAAADTGPLFDKAHNPDDGTTDAKLSHFSGSDSDNEKGGLKTLCVGSLIPSGNAVYYIIDAQSM